VTAQTPVRVAASIRRWTTARVPRAAGERGCRQRRTIVTSIPDEKTLESKTFDESQQFVRTRTPVPAPLPGTESRGRCGRDYLSDPPTIVNDKGGQAHQCHTAVTPEIPEGRRAERSQRTLVSGASQEDVVRGGKVAGHRRTTCGGRTSRERQASESPHDPAVRQEAAITAVLPGLLCVYCRAFALSLEQRDVTSSRTIRS